MGNNCKEINIKFIAIAGPTASGKSIFADKLTKIFGEDKCFVIHQDDYYKDWSHLTKAERKKINFDNIKAFDLLLLEKHIIALKKGMNIQKPCYSFVGSKRLSKRRNLASRPIIIVEGLMPFFTSKLRRLFDKKIYINVNSGVCLARRIKRDMRERGDTLESVCLRYFNDVLPMQKKYVEPQKRWADVVING